MSYVHSDNFDGDISENNSAYLNESAFCRNFVHIHPLKCISGRFYDTDGLVNEYALESEVYQQLKKNCSSGLSTKVSRLMDALRIYSTAAPISSVAISSSFRFVPSSAAPRKSS